MVVQHNITAMNSNRMLGLTQKTLSSSTEKLSSGYAINRAADNAAGLAISEKMRKQIRGLTQASTNAEDGISAVQTAEGALTEVHDMLQRMNELAVQSANGTNSEDDRSYIQDEIDQLTTEIDRVAETTKFNEIYLLKGDTTAETKQYSYQYKKATETAAATVTDADGSSKITDDATTLAIEVSFVDPALDDGVTVAEENDLAKSLINQGVTVSYVEEEDSEGNTVNYYTLSLNGSDAQSTYSVVADLDASDGKFSILDADGHKIAGITVSGGAADGDTATITATEGTAAQSTDEIFSLYDKDGNAISANALDTYVSTGSSGTVIVNADAPKVYDALGNAYALTDLAGLISSGAITNTQNLTAALKLSFHVGADGTSNNKISINIDAMSAKSLGINGLRVDGEDDTNATNAIQTIAAAIKKVSTQRSALGAVQNRLDHTINNLDNIVENTTDAESSIRDTDMATEMVTYSNANILAQAGQSMLAQANQSNQGVLSLLG